MSELARTVLAWEELLQTLGFRLISVLSLPRILGVLVLVSALTAQVAEHQTRIGLPQDWTHNHVVFHRQLLSQHPELAAAEPRVLHQFVGRMPYSPIAVSSPSDEAASSAAAITRDWNVNLGGGKIVLGMSPIKFGRFTGRIMHTTPSSSAQILNSTTSRCSPISEFFNPNIGATGTDFFFWGMTSDCVGNAGCVMSRNSDVILTASQPSGTSVIIVDNISNACQASSIYFTPQRSPRRAVKLTQNGLQ
jgi:hypothetical protein